MASAFVRSFLSDVVEKHLRDAILRGDYGTVLPGERILAKTFKVSRPTLRRALATLSAEGLIRQKQGAPTKIIGKPAQEQPAVDSTRRVVFLSSHPLHQLPPGTMLGFDLLGTKLTHAGLDLCFAACHAFLQRNFENALDGFIQSTPADVYVLHQTPALVQRHLASRDVPCVVMGTPDSVAGLPGVDTDFTPAARHAMGELKRLGHHADRIRLVLPELELMGHVAMRDGFLMEGGSPDAIIRHSGDFETLPAWISTHFLPLLRAKSPPTAIITSWPRFTVALVSGLAMRHGIVIPENLSVVCLADDPVFDMLIPPVSRYRRPAEKYGNRLFRLVLDTAKHRKATGELLVKIEPEFVPGGTLSGPRKT